jgi:hypothetical protein
MKDDRLNTGVEDVIIRDVALRYNESGGCTTFYYHHGTMGIWPRIAQYIVPDFENRRADEATIEILGIVRFDKPMDGPVKR